MLVNEDRSDEANKADGRFSPNYDLAKIDSYLNNYHKLADNPWSEELMSVRLKLKLIIAVIVAMFLASTGVSYVSMQAMSAVRASVAAEAVWSKNQKDATHALTLYLVTRDEEYFQKFSTFMDIPLADRAAREELEKMNPDLSVSDQHMIRGANHPEDVHGMGLLFVLGRNRISALDNAIEAWRRADEEIMRFNQFAQTMRSEILSGKMTENIVRERLSEITKFNSRLSAFEFQFSDAIGDASRWLAKTLQLTTFLAALFLALLGFSLAFSLCADVIKRMSALIQTAVQIENGTMPTEIKVGKNDEISQLEKALSTMSLGFTGMQTRLINAEKMSALGMMAGGIAHEIKTPLL